MWATGVSFNHSEDCINNSISSRACGRLDRGGCATFPNWRRHTGTYSSNSCLLNPPLRLPLSLSSPALRYTTMSAPAPGSKPLSSAEGFICGGTAACVAVRPPPRRPATRPSSFVTRLSGFQVTVSNPAEVAKTRMQLQGELAKRGAAKVYNNALDVIAKTWRNEGIRGVQRGLGPAVSPLL